MRRIRACLMVAMVMSVIGCQILRPTPTPAAKEVVITEQNRTSELGPESAPFPVDNCFGGVSILGRGVETNLTIELQAGISAGYEDLVKASLNSKYAENRKYTASIQLSNLPKEKCDITLQNIYDIYFGTVRVRKELAPYTVKVHVGYAVAKTVCYGCGAVTPTLPSPTPTSPKPSGAIPFYSPTSPNVLNPSLDWSRGGSTGSTYVINGDGTLTLTAGPGTMNWGGGETSPMILYPVSGDFEAQVGILCDPSLVDPHSGFGFGVRSRSDHFTWLQFARSHTLFATQNQSGATTNLTNTPTYGKSAVFLNIKRAGDSFSLSYSEDGNSWSYLVQNFVFSLPQQTEIYLFVFTRENYSLSARFSDLRVFK